MIALVAVFAALVVLIVQPEDGGLVSGICAAAILAALVTAVVKAGGRR